MELSLEIARIPERDEIEKLPPSGSDESLDEGMGEGDIRYSLQLLNLEDLKIRLPSMKLEQWIVVAADRAGY
jgi:hypothetical protein